MSTGIETWNMNLLDIGPMYPFAGTEVFWALLGLASWVIWHVVQMKMENKVLEEDDKLFSDDSKLEKALEISGAQTVYESMKVHDKDSFD